MEHIVFVERDSLPTSVRRPAFAHIWEEYGYVTQDEIVSRLANATIAIINKVRIRSETLCRLPKLRLIAVAATGTDNIDLYACNRQGVAVSNVRGYAVNAVAEHTFALILALRRNLISYRRDVLGGEWRRSDKFCHRGHEICDVHGSKIGIFGNGSIGKSVARIARAFGMQVMFAECSTPRRSGAYAPVENVLQEADIISLHLPLTDQTRNLIGVRELAQMKRTALLINTARGGLVDEVALAAALREGIIGGAGFDVLSIEPPREYNALHGLDLPNFLLTPHVAWASREAIQLVADQVISNVEAFASGHPQNLVTCP